MESAFFLNITNPREGKSMDPIEFKQLRKKMKKTQKQMAQLLGVSLKAIHSYEQGWRTVPPAVERHMYFLLSRLKQVNSQKPCWDVKNCPEERKEDCPAWEFRSGELCWLVSGSICDGAVQGDWAEKMKICKHCKVFRAHMV
jgi:DNA-binding XRE family transcriptional regulator